MASPPKSKNMNPTMSSTAAGSRITVYFPAGISLGPPDVGSVPAATPPRHAGSSNSTFGELNFCHPDESSASMVIEISDDVCECHCASPRELNMPSTDPEEEKIPAVVRLFFFAIATIL